MIWFFEYSLWLMLIFILASLIATIKYKKYFIVPVIVLVVYSIISVYETTQNNAGLAGLVGWTITFTLVPSLISLIIWFIRKMFK